MKEPEGTAKASSALVTIPNAISLARILLIPLFVWLILDEDSAELGLVVFAIVAATDWVDGYVARRTGQVSEAGKILDPLADRLAIVAALIALTIADIFPLWAALLVLMRDLSVLIVGALMFARRRARVEVRWIGKLATFALILGIVGISWGNLGLWLYQVVLAAGWLAFVTGLIEYYLAAGVYTLDLSRAIAHE
jgi:cardiolipin synthase